MSWMPIRFPPGIFKDTTHYSAQGRWYDGNLVRFREGVPERWGGWVKTFDGVQLDGVARSLSLSSSLNGLSYHAVGTSNRFYMIQDDTSYDVTPIETTDTLGSNPLSADSGSAIVTVSHTASVRYAGDIIIISGATTFAGIPAGDLNKEHVVTEYEDDNTYTITVDTPASSTASGGGASVQVEYLYSPGSIDASSGSGWGIGVWGEESHGWGDPTTQTSDTSLGLWSQDNWGEDQIACIRNGPIFYWDQTNPSTRMVDILDLPGADGNAPSQATFITVSEKDRHLLAFGGTSFGGSTINPMEVRWCDQEDIFNWDEGDTAGTAGSLPLSNGSRFIAFQKTSREILLWSDTALYSLQYIGAPFIYAANIIDSFSDIVAMNASVAFGSAVFWMGRSGFYIYDGRVKRIPCPVWDYVSMRWDENQLAKVYASTNSTFNEVIFFYPSEGATDLDSYVTYNVAEDYWTIGSLDRTVWMDTDTDRAPIAIDSNGYCYLHETGADDGSTNPATAISAHVESAPFELSAEGAYDKGDRFFFVRRILPDVSFRSYDDGNNTPTMNIVLKSINKPGGGITTGPSSQVSRSAILPIETYTDDLHVRLRGRGLVIRAESNSLGSLWRMGTPRIDIRPDGQR